MWGNSEHIEEKNQRQSLKTLVFVTASVNAKWCMSICKCKMMLKSPVFLCLSQEYHHFAGSGKPAIIGSLIWLLLPKDRHICIIVLQCLSSAVKNMKCIVLPFLKHICKFVLLTMHHYIVSCIILLLVYLFVLCKWIYKI